MRLRFCCLFSAFAIASVSAPGANAETITSNTYTGMFPASLKGTLSNQATVLEETFNLSGGNLTAYTTSYATGGFQPNLTLYNSSGIAIATQWATPPSGAAADPTTKLTLDSYLTASSLSAGSYVLTLSDWALNQSATATNLSNGFTSNFGNGVTFVDVQGNTRTGAYALTVNASTSASGVPEPGTFLPVALAVFAAALLRKHRAAKPQSTHLFN